jgi:hypothetical protein
MKFPNSSHCPEKGRRFSSGMREHIPPDPSISGNKECVIATSPMKKHHIGLWFYSNTMHGRNK